MRSREIVLLLAAVIGLGALGAIVLGPRTEERLPTGDGPVIATPESDEPEPDSRPAPIAVDYTPTRMARDPEPIAFDPDRKDGAIRGHISLSADVVAGLEFVHVTIREAINTDDEAERAPFRKTVKEDVVAELGTPRFHYDGIPFSEYGYFVGVTAPGVNGTEQFVQLDAEHPVRDVELAITKAHPFTVLLRDQYQVPVTGGHTVFLLPLGDARGRRVLQKAADNYGAAVFEQVLAGPWEVRVGAVNDPLNEKHIVQVVAQAGVDSTDVTVPRGFPLTVQIQTSAGWGLEGARMMLYGTETKQFRKYEAVSDFAGRHVFPHLPPGEYHLNVTADGYNHWGRSVRVPETAPPEELVVQLVRR